jgi:hypothetical protein
MLKRNGKYEAALFVHEKDKLWGLDIFVWVRGELSGIAGRISNGEFGRQRRGAELHLTKT